MKLEATYIRDEPNFQSEAQIYKKTVIIREKIDLNYLEKNQCKG